MIKRLALPITKGLISQGLQIIIIGIAYGALYYQKARHIWGKCWKLHSTQSSKEWGYNGEQYRDNGQTHLSFVQPVEERSLEQGRFNQEEIEKLRTLLGTLEKASSTCSLTLSSKFPISIRLKVSDETFANS